MNSVYSKCEQTLTDELAYANYYPNCGENLLNNLNAEDYDEELFDDMIAEGYDGDSDFFWDNL